MNEEYINFLQKIEEQVKMEKYLSPKEIKKYYKQFPKRKYISYNADIPFSLETLLNFYREYNIDYYKIIMDGLSRGRIVISNDLKDSYVNINSNKAYISPHQSSYDYFLFAHELSHYIDRNLTPHIIDDHYTIFAEVFPRAIENAYVNYLQNISPAYTSLIDVTQNNRLYFARRHLESALYEYYYEKLYLKGKLNEKKFDSQIVSRLMKRNVVDYHLRYFFGEVFSSYLKEHPEIPLDSNLGIILSNLDLSSSYECFEEDNHHKVKVKNL